MTQPHWASPITLSLAPTSDSLSYRSMPHGWTGLPLAPHPGAYGVQRKHHVHEGIDLYCSDRTPVFAMEDGRIVNIEAFTGPNAGSSWWENTHALLVEGESGVVVYGEIEVQSGLAIGDTVRRGDLIGRVIRVLTNAKGRPPFMLHIELHDHGTTTAQEWTGDKPESLRDPTPLLLDAARRGWNPPKQPSFVKAGDRLIPIGMIVDANLADIESARLYLSLSSGETILTEGFDAIEAVWLLRPSALEGRRLRWRKGAWALHNLFAHPAMQLLAWIGFGRAAVRLHDATTPVPRGTRETKT